MNIRPTERVIYDNNPLVEVLCQVRFDRVLALGQSEPVDFQIDFASKHYPSLRIEHTSTIQISMAGGQAPLPVQPEAIQSFNASSIYHFSSLDGKRTVSLSAEFISFSCTEYQSWDVFKTQLQDILETFSKHYPYALVRRIGLRYKDLISREALGLEETKWNDLLTPIVSGVFESEALDESPSINELTVIQQASQTMLQMNGCSLLLQSALLHSAEAPPKQAFLIDTDHFVEQLDFQFSIQAILERAEKLHSNAYSVFRHCIKDKLHVALGPNPVISSEK